MARPKSGNAMVTVSTRVPLGVSEKLIRRARAARRSRAEYLRDLVVADVAPDPARIMPAKVKRKS